MSTKLVCELPSFDTGQFEGAEFTMAGGNARLTIHLAEMEDLTIEFKRVRWHQFTALYNCTVEQIEESYFRLVEIEHSRALSEYKAADTSSVKAYTELHHYRVFLEEHGCHEVFAESAGAA